jgi:hypothetical protein
MGTATRLIEPQARIHVYYNLHKRIWSIRSARTGRIIDHQCNVLLQGNVKFHVQQAGNAKVRATGRKNVHAYVAADSYTIGSTPDAINRLFDSKTSYGSIRDTVQVTYNPYTMTSFRTKPTDECHPESHRADVALIAVLDGKRQVRAFGATEVS